VTEDEVVAATRHPVETSQTLSVHEHEDGSGLAESLLGEIAGKGLLWRGSVADRLGCLHARPAYAAMYVGIKTVCVNAASSHRRPMPATPARSRSLAA